MTGDGVKTSRISDRLRAVVREPSTWSAVAALLAVFIGVNPAGAVAVAQGAATALASDPTTQAAVITAGIAGALGILLPERK